MQRERNPKDAKDVSAAANIGTRQLARSYRLIITEMEIPMPIPEPTRCVAAIASKVQLKEKVRRRALELLQKMKELELSTGKEPMGLARRRSMSHVLSRAMIQRRGNSRTLRESPR